jgi:hypothetical protein
MLRQAKVLDWLLEIDREATTAAYNESLSQTDCQCIYCRNYRAASNTLPAQLTNVLGILGIDPAMPANSSEVLENKDGTHVYIAIYNLVGRIVRGCDYQVSGSGRGDHYHFSEHVAIGFTGRAHFPQGFPPPVLQAEILASIPWVIDEKV